ncbi:MAG: 3'(2'),5'-bisphosphate nucleotidase CysQ [Caulobacterales bacterium 68-7]|nr:3'(2'),5'-bisphosphate nucleotidase CysQ [Caulobacterales bacterium]OJU11924.1 MAG: 3'(2'),5'-bisphosphate nucleotidase CysQ [Caulobacterales bacterium 68-7]
MTDAGVDLALLIDAAREAGALASNRLAAGVTVKAKPGGSPVTDADLAVDALLQRRLIEARPDYGWLSEETADDPARLSKSRVFVVDPIDGTVAFFKNKPWWAVSIAVVEAGQPIAGVVYAPALDELYTAAMGQGAHLGGVRLQASAREALEDAAVLGDARVLAPPDWPVMRIAGRNSVAYRMCLVASGAFDAAIAPTSKNEWDLAAADLIAREAGALSTDVDGSPFDYNRPDTRRPSLVCAAPALHALIVARLTRNSG